jgi:soluble lytic murein transglycosylase-like protein
MQAIYSLSTFVVPNLRADLHKIASLSGLMFLAYSLPYAGQWEQGLAPNDHHLDLSQKEVVDHFTMRLPAQHKQDAHRLGATLMQLSKKYSVSPGLLLSVIETESGFRYSVISNAGAVGLMQLKPSTAQEVAKKNGIAGYRSEADLHDPVVNLQLGVAYLAYLKSRFGLTEHYLAAYNIGPTALRTRMNSGNFGSVSNYVRKIRARTLELKENRLASNH